MNAEVKNNLIRLKDLNVGDFFIWAGVTYEIKSKTEGGGISFKQLDFSAGCSTYRFGINCMMWVEKAHVERRDYNCGRKPVSQFSMRGEHIADYDSISAARVALGSKSAQIGDAAKGKAFSSLGYKWRFKKAS